MIKPISPKQVDKLHQLQLPDEVIDAFNQAIAKEWDGSQAIIKQNEIAEIIASKMDIAVAKVYELGYLNIEKIYEKSGWTVHYDKPAYCETYEATFTFSKWK